MNKKIGYLGPCGTFCESAVQQYSKEKNYQSLAFQTIEAVFSSVDSGEIDLGVLPMENSCEGAVNQTFDLLAYGYPPVSGREDNCSYDIKIIGEIILPVKHSILVRPGIKLEDINCIISHPQALAQCREYLTESFPQVELVEASSTAEAVRQVAQATKPWAAIAMSGVAVKYGLNVLEHEINDYLNNETRFIVISKKEQECNIECKTSLLINVANQPGALYQVLKEFSLRGINLTKIESRPAKTKMGEYLFFIDIDGHYLEPKISDALNEIKTITQPAKVLGSYPAASQNTGRKSEFTPSLQNLRQEVDVLDEQIIEMLGRRTRIVKRIGDFKASIGEVHDPKREEWILEKLSSVAEQKGFSPTVTKDIYKTLFEHFVALQRGQA
ncbi:MAG: hypothetical protein APF76_17135 [Desulfitibacter sp. BRH_c19]|nr:MAG: hypothetical protein APF76_17135 [Desulfitibacter sp. BRH_c19]